MQWYYEKSGEQKGPVEKRELEALFNSGEINSSNLIWCRDMGDWAPYDSVFKQASWLPTAAAVGGNGGQTPNCDLRAMARQSLSGSWGMGALAVFLWQVVQGAAGMVPLLGPIAQLAIGGAMMIGLYGFFIQLRRSGVAEIGLLFQGFSQFWTALGMYLLTSFLVFLAATIAAVPGISILIYIGEAGTVPIEENPLFFLGLLLSVVPFLITSTVMMLRYGLVFFIAYDHPDLGVGGAIRKSVSMMKGRKWKLFFLGLSFIGWHFLGMLAFLVGLLWSSAYMFTAFAAFYDDLKEV